LLYSLALNTPWTIYLEGLKAAQLTRNEHPTLSVIQLNRSLILDLRGNIIIVQRDLTIAKTLHRMQTRAGRKHHLQC
ncbi:MAG: hypothetical protein AAFR04_14370, partial [Pseudomonadota bacterium]